MEKLKVGLNFSCNGVSKKKGEVLNQEELSKIGEGFGKQLMKSGHIISDHAKINFPKVGGGESQPLSGIDVMSKNDLIKMAEKLKIDLDGNPSAKEIRVRIKRHKK